MHPRRLVPLLLAGLSAIATAVEPPAAPRSTDPRMVVELVAAEPDVRTPTAVSVDARGRIWVLENNTHFRPKKYDAPPTDRILVLEDFGPDGRARKITPFWEGFSDGMGVLALADGRVLISTRNDTFTVRDTDGDGRGDERKLLLHLVTEDKYPHNGLSGVAIDSAGYLYVGLGENHGVPWTLTGADGRVLQGSDEGAIFRCKTDGSEVIWWAMGLWNPYGLAFDRQDRLFALDNDPSGGSLCRLVHVVPGGDYGYRYRYGRTIDHPFLSWFGQIPGTLPPVCLSGEAPTGMISFRGTGILPEWDGQLLGCTWSDHGVQRFPLEARGVSFSAKPQWALQGASGFRPSGIAQAPDGSLIVSDWVDGAYELHGKGRVWRMRARESSGGGATGQPAPVAATVVGTDPSALLAMLRSEDPFVVHQGIQGLAALPLAKLLEAGRDTDAKVRLGVLLAARRTRLADARPGLAQWLSDPDGTVRRAALQWIGEERIQEFQAQLDKALSGTPERATFEAYIAAHQLVGASKPDHTGKLDSKAAAAHVARVALDTNRPASIRALALRLLPVETPTMPVDVLRGLLANESPEIRGEAARVLASRTDPSAQVELRRIASDKSAALALRAEALAGLAHSASYPDTETVLKAAAEDGNPTLAREARRSLGLPPIAQDTPPPGTEADPAAGRRLFYHPNGPRCAVCHEVAGRGGVVGPDLTQIGRLTPEKLLEAIQNPSSEIAPAYAQWHVQMRDGRDLLGINLFEDSKSTITLIDANGTRTKLNTADIAASEVLPVSLMPPALDQSMTPAELRDLLAFLQQQR